MVKYDQTRLEQYAMRALQMSESQGPADLIEIDEVGKALGMDPVESRQIAVWLKDKGWASVTFQNQDSPRLQLTLRGREEIADLFLPWWRRFCKKNKSVLWALAGVFITGAFTLLAQLLRWLLEKF